MTALSLPMTMAQPRAAGPRVPWVTGLVFFVLFAMAGWSWNPSQRWYATSNSDVDALVDRIAEGQMSRQVAFVLFAVYGLGVLAMPSDRAARPKLRVMYPIVLFVGWAFVSAAWSVDTSQTLKRLAIFAATLLTVAGILKHMDVKQIAQLALICSGLTLLVGLCIEGRNIVVDHPDFGRYRFGGLMHPNHAGLNSIVVMLACQYLFTLTKRKTLLALFAVAAVVMFLTKSRTSLMSGTTGVLALWALSSPPTRLGWSLLLAAWGAAAAIWLSGLGLMDTRVGGLISMGRDDVKQQDVSQLTGRTDIWNFAILQAEKDPNRTLIGYGYETFWTPENARGVSEFVKFKISEGHCVYLDWYLELGLVGGALYVLILLTAIARWGIAARGLASPSAAVAAAILIASVVHGFAESSLGDAGVPTLFVYLSIAGSGLLRPDEMELA